ncbi:MAG: hypothetical protein HYT79_07045 [Elusimicrobia bacterium]|nr:hypothetical protein [Elusimicrobiota bacterium]
MFKSKTKLAAPALLAAAACLAPSYATENPVITPFSVTPVGAVVAQIPSQKNGFTTGDFTLSHLGDMFDALKSNRPIKLDKARFDLAPGVSKGTIRLDRLETWPAHSPYPESTKMWPAWSGPWLEVQAVQKGSRWNAVKSSISVGDWRSLPADIFKRPPTHTMTAVISRFGKILAMETATQGAGGTSKWGMGNMGPASFWRPFPYEVSSRLVYSVLRGAHRLLMKTVLL